MGKPGQTEITLKDDLPERERTDLYKTYLLYCLTGEVTKIPFDAEITTKKDDSEFVLLNQLGGILGLGANEIVEVHRSLAKQAFRQQGFFMNFLFPFIIYFICLESILPIFILQW